MTYNTTQEQTRRLRPTHAMRKAIEAAKARKPARLANGKFAKKAAA